MRTCSTAGQMSAVRLPHPAYLHPAIAGYLILCSSLYLAVVMTAIDLSNADQGHQSYLV